DVEGPAVRSLVRDRSVEDFLVGFALVEAEMNEGAYPSPALRRPEDQRIVDAAGDRVDRAGVGGRGIAAQEGGEIARRRETDTRHDRILGRVNQFIDVIGVEP